ncbi:unnamed protein product [Protopolystoma xenopodis]|uniref:Uncharacterized protein n=1 Tax=Protopolystoma xenopodis TaxID=117903 RepID=A0A448WVS6_9PLAT|nr:unnamed protein product [Protopolystoma xenopodis]
MDNRFSDRTEYRPLVTSSLSDLSPPHSIPYYICPWHRDSIATIATVNAITNTKSEAILIATSIVFFSSANITIWQRLDEQQMVRLFRLSPQQVLAHMRLFGTLRKRLFGILTTHSQTSMRPHSLPPLDRRPAPFKASQNWVQTGNFTPGNRALIVPC